MLFLGSTCIWNLFNCNFGIIKSIEKTEYIIWHDDIKNKCRTYTVIYVKYDRK